MCWDEFCTLLAGLNGDTPLGNIVRIRSEQDSDRLKNFTPEEWRIRNEWYAKQPPVTTVANEDQYNADMEALKASLKAMCN